MTARPKRFLAGLVKILLWLALILLLALGTAYGWLRRTSDAQVSGNIQLTGLEGSVTVTRDQWGVPHIRAEKSDLDAFYALGFVHWQDRAWQMEFQRRVAQGRLAEVLGEAALPQDKFLRTWGFQRAAQSIPAALSERGRSAVQAYTAGVNAAMHQGKVPLEFRILGFQPEAWTEVDSLSWSKLMAYDLGGNMDDEVLGAQVVSRLGGAALSQIIAPYPAGAPTILSADELRPSPVAVRPAGSVDSALSAQALSDLSAHLQAARQLGMQPVPGKGSNDWVVSGQHTQSGKPLLADDPHLSLTSPMLWYLADLQGPGLNVIGASIPGLPGVVIGRNDHVAWGVTNVGPDVQDLFIEPPSAKLTERTEIIKVKGQADVTLKVQESQHGPIVSQAGAEGLPESRTALQWTALQAGDTTMDAFLGLNYAQNWQDFTQALSKYVAPSQNFVYADIDGNTGYYAPGRIPIRSGWDGSLPVTADGKHEWQGFIPFEELPHTFNPADGLVVTANNRVVPNSYTFNLGNIRNWAEPYRSQRITALLQEKPQGLSVEDMRRVQLDTISLVWEDYRDILLTTSPQDDLSRQALNFLKDWDGNETISSVPASIFEAWLMQLRGMARDELKNEYQMNSLSALAQLQTDGKLCAEQGQGNCAAELTRTLKAAVDDLSTRLGSDPNKWVYGSLHHVASNHRAFGKVNALAWLFNHAAPTPGGTNTVNVAPPELNTFRQTHGPSYRQIVDLSDLNRSLFVGSLGQNGNPIGAHASDQQAKWVNGEYLPMSTDPRDWGRSTSLTLRPGQ